MICYLIDADNIQPIIFDRNETQYYYIFLKDIWETKSWKVFPVSSDLQIKRTKLLENENTFQDSSIFILHHKSWWMVNYNAFTKVHIFWEGHKILRNLHRRFDRYYEGQIYGGDFAKFCGLLIIYMNFKYKNALSNNTYPHCAL